MRKARMNKMTLGEVHASGLKYRREGQDNFYRFGEDGVLEAGFQDAIAMDYELEPQPEITDIWHIPLSTKVDYRKLEKDDNRAEVFVKVVRKNVPGGKPIFTAAVVGMDGGEAVARAEAPVKKRGPRKGSKRKKKTKSNTTEHK